MTTKRLLLILMLLIVLGAATWFLYSWDIHNIESHRRFLYCDLLETGMRQEEVEQVLSKIGPYTKLEDKSSEYSIYVYIYFQEKSISHLYGNGIVLHFKDGLYNGAAVQEGVSDFVSICNDDIGK